METDHSHSTAAALLSVISYTTRLMPGTSPVMRRADAIFREEINESGQDRRLMHFFAVLTDTRALGRPGTGQRGYVCALRAVSRQGASGYSVGKLPYDLLDRVARRVTAEVPGISRVVLDITDSSAAEVEWE